MKLIKRDRYIDRLSALRGTPDIKVITGVRRAGKSRLLEDLKDLIVAEGRKNVIFIDLSDLANESLCGPDSVA